MEDTLKGKVVLVTGAGSGLGEATARAFARAGCAVACLDLNQAAAERVAAGTVRAVRREQRHRLGADGEGHGAR